MELAPQLVVARNYYGLQLVFLQEIWETFLKRCLLGHSIHSFRTGYKKNLRFTIWSYPLWQKWVCQWLSGLAYATTFRVGTHLVTVIRKQKRRNRTVRSNALRGGWRNICATQHYRLHVYLTCMFVTNNDLLMCDPKIEKQDCLEQHALQYYSSFLDHMIDRSICKTAVKINFHRSGQGHYKNHCHRTGICILQTMSVYFPYQTSPCRTGILESAQSFLRIQVQSLVVEFHPGFSRGDDKMTRRCL